MNVEPTPVSPEFAYYKLNENGREKSIIIAQQFSLLLDFLKNYCIDGREFSICKTKLEEACFFAKKSMSINLVNQDHS